jgi:hypothetical protein
MVASIPEHYAGVLGYILSSIALPDYLVWHSLAIAYEI